jgi:hypothetical protein
MTDTTTRTPNQPKGVETIQLQNPVRQNFAPYIFGNATKCNRVALEGSAVGQHLVIAGAGPSLRETASKWCPQADQVWGTNSAAIWLYNQGHKVTHAFTVDQTAHMLEEWASVPPIEYLIASSCNPFLTELLESKGRTVTFFHNYCGVEGQPVAYAFCKACTEMFDRADTCPKCSGTDVTNATVSYEEWMYSALYPSTCCVGSGLNATTRAIDLAGYMGFSKITVLGADCAMQTRNGERVPTGMTTGSPEHIAWLTNNTTFHADGGHALASEASCLTLGADICTDQTCGRKPCDHPKRYWLSKPDLLITALWLIWMKRQYGSRLRIMGDTLVRALMNKPDAFLERLPMLTTATGEPIRFTAPDPGENRIERGKPLMPPVAIGPEIAA